MKDKICFKIYAIEKTIKKEKKGVPKREEILRSHVNLIENENNDNQKNKVPYLKRSFTQAGFLKKGGKNNGDKNDKKDCSIF